MSRLIFFACGSCLCIVWWLCRCKWVTFYLKIMSRTLSLTQEQDTGFTHAFSLSPVSPFCLNVSSWTYVNPPPLLSLSLPISLFSPNLSTWALSNYQWLDILIGCRISAAFHLKSGKQFLVDSWYLSSLIEWYKQCCIAHSLHLLLWHPLSSQPYYACPLVVCKYLYRISHHFE